MIMLLLMGCAAFDAPYKEWNNTVPEALDDGWAVGSPEDVGLDPAALEAMHEELLREDQYFGTLGVLIARDGTLVFEAWLRDPADRDRQHNLQSATKSVTSTVVGIGWDQGWLPDLDSSACDVLGEACEGLGADKGAITLDHLLTMRSGLDLDNDYMAYDLTVRQPDDPLRYLLDLPMYAPAGEEFYYRDVDPQVMAYVIAAAAGRTEEEVASSELFAPLGIEEWTWLSLHDGASTGAFGLYLRPRDFAKLGQVMLDGGSWDGQQVLSAAWHDLALEEAEIDAWEEWGYARSWWVSPDGDAFTAAGHGGQFAMWVPSQGLLAVQVALPDAELHGSQPGDFYELIRPLWP